MLMFLKKVEIYLPHIFNKWIYVKSNDDKIASAEVVCMECGKKKVLNKAQIENLTKYN